MSDFVTMQQALDDLFSAIDRCVRDFGLDFTRSEADAHLDKIRYERRNYDYGE